MEGEFARLDLTTVAAAASLKIVRTLLSSGLMSFEYVSAVNTSTVVACPDSISPFATARQ
jgi:hypothetical protein